MLAKEHDSEHEHEDLYKLTNAAAQPPQQASIAANHRFMQTIYSCARIKTRDSAKTYCEHGYICHSTRPRPYA